MPLINLGHNNKSMTLSALLLVITQHQKLEYTLYVVDLQVVLWWSLLPDCPVSVSCFLVPSKWMRSGHVPKGARQVVLERNGN